MRHANLMLHHPIAQFNVHELNVPCCLDGQTNILQWHAALLLKKSDWLENDIPSAGNDLTSPEDPRRPL